MWVWRITTVACFEELWRARLRERETPERERDEEHERE